MSDNVFQHNTTGTSPISEHSAATPPPFPAPSPSKTAPALSVVYVIPYLLFLVFTCGIFATARIFKCCDGRCRRDSDEEQGYEDSNHERLISEHSRGSFSRHSARHSHRSTPRNSSTSIGEATVVALGMSDRIRLYRRTFDKNNHYHILSPMDFRCDQTEDEAIHEGDDENNEEDEIKSLCAVDDNDIDSVNAIDEEDPLWVYLPMTPAENDSNDSNQCEESTLSPKKKELDKDTIYSSHTCQTIETIPTEDSMTVTEEAAENTKPPLTKVSGTCIICFEKFKVGETVVWSDDTTQCRHVFHEDCMVRYLANHSKRTKRRASSEGYHSAISYSYAENPCPICRRTFCTVQHDDLVMAVLLKSVAVALGEEEEDLPAHGGGGEGSPFTSSERSQRIAATTYALASATIGTDSMPESFHREFQFDDI